MPNKDTRCFNMCKKKLFGAIASEKYPSVFWGFELRVLGFGFADATKKRRARGAAFDGKKQQDSCTL